jgi:hypothetical protein
MKKEIEKYRAENPKITEQFADLKRQLAEVVFLGGAPEGWGVGRGSAAAGTGPQRGPRSGHAGRPQPRRPPLARSPPPNPALHRPQVKAEEWEAIPDIGDYTIKRQKRETFAPAPDSLLAAAANAAGAGGSATTLDVNGLATPAGSASSVSNLTDIGAQARWGESPGIGAVGGGGAGRAQSRAGLAASSAWGRAAGWRPARRGRGAVAAEEGPSPRRLRSTPMLPPPLSRARPPRAQTPPPPSAPQARAAPRCWASSWTPWRTLSAARP